MVVIVPLALQQELFHIVCACNVQVIGVIDVDRSKEKGYETIVKEGFCDEVGYTAAVICGFNIFPALVLASFFFYGFMSVVLFV